MKIFSIPLLSLRVGAVPELSSAGEARIYYDEQDGILVSYSGADWEPLGSTVAGGAGAIRILADGVDGYADTLRFEGELDVSLVGGVATITNPGLRVVGGAVDTVPTQLTFAGGLSVSQLGSVVTVNGGFSDGNYGDVTISGAGTSIQLNTGSVGNTELRNSAALSVIGRAANSSGSVADIATSSGSGSVLRESGGVLGFGQISADAIADGSVGLNKLFHIDTNHLIGRYSVGTGPLEEIALNPTLEFDGSGNLQRAALTGDIIAAAGSNSTVLADNSVTDAKLRDSAALSVIGRAANSIGDPADIATTSGSNAILRESGGTLGFGTIIGNSIQDGTIALSKFNDINTDRLLGRTSSGAGALEEISIDSTLEFDGYSNLRRAALTGDVTVPAGSNVSTITDGTVTIAKLAPIATDKLIGRDSAGTGAVELIGLNSTLEFDGYGNIQRAALTGDIIAAAGSNSTAIASNAVTNTKFRQSSALSVVGRSANSTGNIADISTTGGSSAVLRESGNTIGFGTVTSGGIANAAITNAKLRDSTGLSVIGNSTGSSAVPADIVASVSGTVLRNASGVLGFGTVAAAGISVSDGYWDGYNVFAGATTVQGVIDALDTAITMTAGANKVVQALPEGVIDFDWTLNDCGNGSDGDLVVSGQTHLDGDRQYGRLTILPGGSVVCDTSLNEAGGWILRAQIVDLRTADARCIRTKQSNITPTTASGSTGASNGALASHYAGTVGGSVRPSGGSTGVVGVGVAGAAAAAANVIGGTIRGKGGAGGAGTSGAGGAGGTAGNATIFVEPRMPGAPAVMWATNAQGGGAVTIANGGAPGAPGGSGAGDGTNAGGGGGVGGQGIKTLDVKIGILIVGSNTNAPMIDGSGCNGGGGGTPAAGNTGGGGGGGGSAGSRVFLDVGLIISTNNVTNFVTASGGNGGPGGNGMGTGIGGSGGDGGGGGKIVYTRRILSTTTTVDNRAVAGSAATVASTIAGTAGGTGAACNANLIS